MQVVTESVESPMIIVGADVIHLIIAGDYELWYLLLRVCSSLWLLLRGQGDKHNLKCIGGSWPGFRRAIATKTKSMDISPTINYNRYETFGRIPPNAPFYTYCYSVGIPFARPRIKVVFREVVKQWSTILYEEHIKIKGIDTIIIIGYDELIPIITLYFGSGKTQWRVSNAPYDFHNKNTRYRGTHGLNVSNPYFNCGRNHTLDEIIELAKPHRLNGIAFMRRIDLNNLPLLAASRITRPDLCRIALGCLDVDKYPLLKSMMRYLDGATDCTGWFSPEIWRMIAMMEPCVYNIIVRTSAQFRSILGPVEGWYAKFGCKFSIDPDGDRRYEYCVGSSGVLHRDDGPASILVALLPDQPSHEYWYQHGKRIKGRTITTTSYNEYYNIDNCGGWASSIYIADGSVNICWFGKMHHRVIRSRNTTIHYYFGDPVVGEYDDADALFGAPADFLTAPIKELVMRLTSWPDLVAPRLNEIED